MERARIAMIEDGDNIRQSTKLALEDNGHTVVGEATSIEEARKLIDEIAQGDKEVDVILLDGNLRSNNFDGQDGVQIANYLKERGIGALLIGFSANRLADLGVAVAVDSRKDIKKVLEAIKAWRSNSSGAPTVQS